MARRRKRKRQSGLDALVEAPWPVSAVLGIVGFAVVRYGPGWAALATGNVYLVSMTEPFREGGLAPLAWLILGLCWFASAISFLKGPRKPQVARASRRRRAPTVDLSSQPVTSAVSPASACRRFVDTGRSAEATRASGHANGPAAVTAENIANLSWLQFEQLIAASYRRKGFSAELTPEGADGGVDIVLRERDNVLLVQCKHWNSYQVGVNVARELFGVMHARGARKAVLATSGRLTAEAERFCRDNAIYWLDADRLFGFIDPDAMPSQHEIAADRASRCPLCGDAMRPRTARKTGRRFLGCVRYPSCRGKRFMDVTHA